jgi:hypothetical protein
MHFSYHKCRARVWKNLANPYASMHMGVQVCKLKQENLEDPYAPTHMDSQI